MQSASDQSKQVDDYGHRLDWSSLVLQAWCLDCERWISREELRDRDWKGSRERCPGKKPDADR